MANQGTSEHILAQRFHSFINLTVVDISEEYQFIQPPSSTMGMSDREQQRTSDNHHCNCRDENPFVAFRRYADEQISSLLQSVVGLPSTFSRPSSRDWFFDDERDRSRFGARHQDGEGRSAEQAKNEQDKSWYDLVHIFDEEDEPDNRSYHRKSPFSCLRDHWDAPHPFHDFWGWGGRPDFFGRSSPFSFFDSPWDGMMDGLMFPFGFPRSGLFDFMDPSSASSWPIPYLLFSPYSPLHLERPRNPSSRSSGFLSWLSSDHSEASEPHELRWRLAFEDLLRLENGKKMLENDSLAAAKSESPSNWITGMVQRGSLGNHWKVQNTPHRDGEKVLALTYDSSEPDSKPTEPRHEDDSWYSLPKSKQSYDRDHYDELFHPDEDVSAGPLTRTDRQMRQRPWEIAQPDQTSSSKSTVNSQQQISTSIPSSSENSSIPVSTTITTNRRALADGSIETKRVQTKRFSDGREESNETVHTTNPRPQTIEDKQKDAESKPANDGSSRGGWFWR